MQPVEPAKTPRILSSQQAADRLGLPVQVLYKLRDADERLAISQTGLQIGYQLDDLQDYERSEMQRLVEQALAADRPLPLIRAMSQLLRAPLPSELKEPAAPVVEPPSRRLCKLPTRRARPGVPVAPPRCAW